ncbi:MAG TPA: endonuclease/exonuclease/phosphatase family protein [Chlamydiales bacterium]|nr:endonuclease/exonuclease/phosphatase family protein [Chlamydiales bacterium]
MATSTPILINTNRTHANNPVDFSSNLAPQLLQCARWVTKPMWWTTEQVLRIVMPIIPGKYDQCTDKTDEIIYRILKGFIAIPSITVTIPLGFASCIPRFIGTCLQKEDFVHLKGNIEVSPSFLKKKFTVLSMNICGMPGGLSLIFGGVPPLNSRISRIVERILAANADVVLLQEVHDEDGAYELYDRLKNKYSDFYLNIGTQATTLNSGLFACIKSKTVNPSFSSFKEIEGSHRSVNKGCFNFTIGSKEAPIAHIFHAHLQPSPDDMNPTSSEKKTRQLELQHILRKMHSIPNRMFDAPIVLAGDMNIAYGSEEYNDSILSNHFITSYDESGFQETCAISFTQYVWTYSSEKRNLLDRDRCITLDYTVVLKQDQDIQEHKVETFLAKTFDTSKPELALSDHNAILSKIIG